jgi:regulator of sirC expression with transglutaminase-like and TPR domain
MVSSYTTVDFQTLARLPDERIDVLTGALLIARDAYAGLDLASERVRVDDLARPLGRLEGLPAEEQAEIVSERLFGECGFRGNTEDYYDPRNSFLNDVLVRRLGIPISLSVLYVEVARRAGVVAHGVGFPGHFLVRIERDGGAPLLLDPFVGGRVVGKSTLESMVRRAPRARRVAKSLIAPASSREVLSRMLANLKAVYAARGDLPRLLLVTSRILELQPDQPAELRDRGLLAMRMGAGRVARGDISRYLELVPEAEDAGDLRRLLRRIDVAAPWN